MFDKYYYHNRQSTTKERVGISARTCNNNHCILLHSNCAHNSSVNLLLQRIMYGMLLTCQTVGRSKPRCTLTTETLAVSRVTEDAI